MQIQITGRHLAVTDAMKDYVEEKISKLANHFDHILFAHVIMSVEKERHIAEARIEVPGNDIIAQADGLNMYEAIDLLEDKLDRQVRKKKNLTKSHVVKRDKYDDLSTSDEPLEVREG